MKNILLVTAALLVAAVVSAQGPDLSGKWKLNNSKSMLGADFSLAPLEIIVVQKGNNFTVEKHSNFQGEAFTTTDKLTLDGKECVNTAWQDSQKKSTVTISDDKKSIKVTSKLNIGDAGDVTIIEIYKMNGSSMVIESTASSSYGDLTETMVYDKV